MDFTFGLRQAGKSLARKSSVYLLEKIKNDPKKKARLADLMLDHLIEAIREDPEADA